MPPFSVCGRLGARVQHEETKKRSSCGRFFASSFLRVTRPPQETAMDSIKRLIRDIPDFPKPGIIFKDITPILGDPAAMARITGAFEREFEAVKPTRIVGIESRGFIFGAVLATELELPFTPVRKPGKLPYDTISVSYTLEYGQGSLEMHTDGVTSDDRVLIIDDLLAT